MVSVGIGLVLLAGLGGVALVQRRIDPETLRRAVVASVERQSGRTATLGRLQLRLLPSPRIEADDFTLGDRPGSGAPEMLRVGHLSAGLGVWPLLRHVVRLDPLRLEQVTLHVLRDADGHNNWEMGPKPTATSGGGGGHGGMRWGIELGTVLVDTARLTLRDRLAQRGADLRLTAVTASGLQGEQPHVSLAGERAGAAYEVHGVVGPVRRLFDSADRRTDWPVSLQGSETIAGSVVAHAGVTGTIADPVHGRGYALSITATVTRLADLNRLFVHAALPQMQGLDASADIVDDGHLAVTALRAKAGRTVLPALRDVTVSAWSLAAPSAAAPAAIAVGGAWRGQKLTLKGTIGSLRALTAMLGAHGLPAQAAPVRLALGLGGSAWRIDGQASAAEDDLRLQGFIPDLHALWPEAPDPGPLTLGARLQAGRARRFRLSELRLASAAGDLEGALTLSLRGRPTLSGQLRSQRIDADRLARPVQGAPVGTVAQSGAASPALSRPEVMTARPEAVPAGPAVVPPQADAVLPWALLRRADADLSLQVAELLIGGQHYRRFMTHAVLKDARLLVEPLRADGPAGAIEARLQADASASPPVLGVWMHPVMLPAATLDALLGGSWFPLLGTGGVQLVGQVDAGGETASALAASAHGHVGLSMTDAVVSNATLLRLVGSSSGMAAALPAGGETAVRCLALHAALASGQAAVDTLSLRTARLSVDGHGRVALADGSLDLHLLPEASIGAARASLPVRLGGSLRDPHPALDASATGGRYTLRIGGADAAATDCDGPLRIAREGLAGPAASPIVMGGGRKSPKPADILRGLGLLR